MAVFLTQNAPGLRTSPVKRGYWVVRRVLGETIPPPPPVGPGIAEGRSQDGSAAARRARRSTVRIRPAPPAMRASIPSAWRSRTTARSASGATRISPDAAPWTTQALLPGGVQASGFAGVQEYIRQHRQNDYLDNLSRKLLVVCAEPIADPVR